MIAILKLYQRFAAITTTPLFVRTTWLLCNKSRKKVPEKNNVTSRATRTRQQIITIIIIIIITSIHTSTVLLTVLFKAIMNSFTDRST